MREKEEALGEWEDKGPSGIENFALLLCEIVMVMEVPGREFVYASVSEIGWKFVECPFKNTLPVSFLRRFLLHDSRQC